MGAMKSVLCNRGLGIQAKKSLYEGVIVPTVLYGAEARGMRSAERRKVNVLEMKCLKNLDEGRLARRVMTAEVNGRRVRGRLRFGWTEGVKVALGNRGMTVEAARRCARDRNEWRALVRMQMIVFYAAIFAGFLCSF